MLFHFKTNALIKIFCLIAFLPNIKSNCAVKYTNNIDNVPKFEKFFGKLNIRVPTTENEEFNYITLFEGEILKGFCETYFSPIIYNIEEEIYDSWRGNYKTKYEQKYFSNLSSIVLNCNDSAIYYNSEKLLEQNFSCMTQNYSIYSTKDPYSWCKNNNNSSTLLFVGGKETDLHILAGICYNIDQMSLQTLVYNTTNVRRNNLNQLICKNNMMSNKSLDENFWNFNSLAWNLSDKLLQKELTEMAKTDEWINLANYEVSPIVQNDVLRKHFKGYENILNIIWWRNLRVGNWKRFEDTLMSYVNNNVYEVYMGSSGVAKYPTPDKCYKEKYFEVKFGFKNETIPAYVWAYLKSNDDLNKEFIMVGYNSPYADYFTMNEIVFCPDICLEVPWLKAVSKTFRYINAGIMFCCSTDFIRQTNYLQGFPLEMAMPPQVASTAKTITTENNYIITTENENIDF